MEPGRTPPPRRPAGLPSWSEAAEDWLAAKRVGRHLDDPGHSDRARRGDLRRWAEAINTVQGRDQLGPYPAGSLDGWEHITAELGDEVLLRALDLLGQHIGPASRQRALSTLRGFCAYLTRRGLLPANPCDAPELTVTAPRSGEVRAFRPADVTALLVAATAPPPPNTRSAWPERDAAIVDTLAHCGLRVSELTGLSVDSIDRAAQTALLRVRSGAKGGRARLVPIPSATLARMDAYLHTRQATAASPLPGRSPLFVRHDGTALNQQFVDALLRRLTTAASVPAPDGAMAHALRHFYGTDLALRGVPVPVIQQLLGHADPRTTSIYTTTHGTELAHALHDAGLL